LIVKFFSNEKRRVKIATFNKKLIFLFTVTALILISCEEETVQFSDKIEYEIQNYRIVSEDCDTAGRCAYVEFKYPVFSGPANSPAASILNSYVKTALLADDYVDSAVATIDEFGQNFVKEYENFTAEFTDYQTGWALEREIKVIYNTSKIISLEFYEYSFMGGAHPITMRTFQSFYSKTGAIVVIEDSKIINKLTAIAEEEFRNSSAGYLFENDEFCLNDNFAITEDGLIFYFNPYEIAPYSFGPAKIILKRDKTGNLIDEIINKGGS
jgi:hypothetical protein